MSLLAVKNLSISFGTPLGDLKAVDDVSFEVRKGESLAIVGESGCGKSSLALAIMGLINRRHASLDGEIIFDSRDLSRMTEKQLQDIRGNRIATIFQDPMTSLNPYLPIGIQIAESQCFHHGTNKKTALNEAADLIERVGIPDGRNKINRYPHEFSGGMRQRALIASALSCSPELLIADEPTTALDVTIQAQILAKGAIPVYSLIYNRLYLNYTVNSKYKCNRIPGSKTNIFVLGLSSYYLNDRSLLQEQKY